MRMVDIDMCEFCGKEMGEKVKGVGFECNAGCYHYVCKKCFEELKMKEELK